MSITHEGLAQEFEYVTFTDDYEYEDRKQYKLSEGFINAKTEAEVKSYFDQVMSKK